MTDVSTTGLECPRCKSKNVKEEDRRLTSPNAVGSIGSWRIGWGYGVSIAVIAFGLLALYVRSYVDPTLSIVFLAIGIVSFIYGLYVLATSIYAMRMTRVKKFVCQKCLHEWSAAPAPAG